MNTERMLIRMALDTRTLHHHSRVMEHVLADAAMQAEEGSDGENSMIQIPYSYLRDAVAASSVVGCYTGLRFYGPVFVAGAVVGSVLVILFSRLG